MKFISSTLFILFSLSINLTGNNPILATIVGVVQEAGHITPIEYATISLYSAQDSLLVTGTISEANGSFQLNKIKPGNYFITVSFIGFKSSTIPNIDLITNNQNTDLGIIALEPDVLALEEVVVSTTRSAISLQTDKQVINVSGNLSAHGGSAVDALKTSPSVRVDQDGNLNLRGSQNFTVLINGRPSALTGGEVLKQTPANLINKIEIITNPSVKFQAEGGAGIINIILKKGIQRGLNGLVNFTWGTKSKYASDLSINLNTEKVNLTASLDWADKTKTAVHEYFRELISSDSIHHAFLDQDRTSNNHNLGFRFNVDYTPSSKSRLGYSLNTGYTENKIDILAKTGGSSQPPGNQRFGLNTYKFIQKPTFFTNNLNYTYNFAETKILSINTYYSYIDYYLLTSHNQAIADAHFQVIDPQPYQQEILNENFSNDVRITLDYEQGITADTKIESGVSFQNYSRNLDISFDQFNYEENAWIKNPLYTNLYDYAENIYGSYLNMSTKLSGFNTTIGLRVEYMDRILNQVTSDANFTYQKLNFFPGFSISKSFENQSNVTFSLSNRINRPDEYMMNPFPEFEDDYFYSEGNPDLVPELIRSLEFNYQLIKDKAVLSASAYYRHTRDKIEQKLTLGRQNKIFTVFHNDAQDESIGLELMGNFNLAKWISLNANTNLFHYQIKGHIDESPFSEKDFSWTSQLVGSFHLPKAIKLQLIGYYASETTRSQGKLSDYYFMDIALNKGLFNDKISLSFQLKDVLQSLNYELITNSSNLNLVGDFNNESPTFLITLSYQISKYKKLTKDVVTDFDM